MKFRVLVAFAMGLLLTLPAVAQFSQYNSYNGKYSKSANGCTTEAKIDFNGIPHKGSYIDDEGAVIDYTKYYGYIKLNCGVTYILKYYSVTKNNRILTTVTCVELEIIVT